MTMLSVIIPTFNRNDLLSKCLDSLAPTVQSIDETLYEVIVSDDSLENIAKELIDKKYPWVIWVSGPQKGPAANRNNGTKFANGDWFVFIDDDCQPVKDLLIEYLIVIENSNFLALEGCIQADRIKQRFDEESPINLNGGKFWSCNIAVKRELFMAVNGFDEGFPFSALEDVDFHNRIKQIAEITFVKSAKVIHPWRKTKPFQNYRKWLISNEYALKKNNTVFDKHYRLLRIKIFIGSFVTTTKELVGFSFNGCGFYFEKLWFHFLMIFISK